MFSFSAFSPQIKVTQAEKKLQDLQGQIGSLREEQETLSEENLKLKEQVKATSKAHKEQEVLEAYLTVKDHSWFLVPV